MKGSITAALSLALALTVSLSGCAAFSGQKGFAPSESSALIRKDGSLQWASIETYNQGDYSQDELAAFAKERISAFNEGLGKEAQSENQEGAEALPAAFVSASMSDGTACLITEYDKAERLVEFSREIGDDTMPFTSLQAGRIALLGGDIAGTSFTDAKGNIIDGASVAADGEKLAVRAEGAGRIQIEGTVLYVSEGCTLTGENLVDTAAEGTSYIVLK